MISLVTFHIGDVQIIGAGLPARDATIGDVLYDRIDVIRLYVGRVYEGIIVSSGDKFLVISTPDGRIEIPVNKIKYTGIKK